MLQRYLLPVLLFAFLAGLASATAPFTMNLTSNTFYRNTNSTQLSIYAVTHSAPLRGYLAVAPPSSLLYIVPVNLTNSQTAATPAPFQQMVSINESTYSSYLTYNGSFANFEFLNGTSSHLPAWIEGVTNGNILVWVKVPYGIPASSKLTIYLGLVAKTTNLLSSSGTSGIGEAPQLSSTYAEYDDGASVFTNYWNFAGTKLPSSWTQSGGILTVDNGLTYEFDGNGDSLSTPSINFETNITDYYGYLSGGAATYSSTFAFLYPVGSGIGFTGYGGVYGVDNNNNHVTISPSTDIDTGNILISFYANSSDTFASINNNPYTSVAGAPGTAPPTTGGFYWSSAFTSSGTYGYIQWLNTRALPPDGVMPSVTFGSKQSPSPAQAMQKVVDLRGGSVTITGNVYSLTGYNTSAYLLVQPDEYYMFNFTNATFVGQYNQQAINTASNSIYLIQGSMFNRVEKMTNPIPLAVIAIVSMWILFAVALIFYKEGDDKRTLLLLASTVLAILSIFSMLIPTYSVVHVPDYNVTITTGNSISTVSYPALNETNINPPYSNPVITLYTIFGVFQAFIFLVFAFWSFKYRLQYKTYREFKNEMRKNTKFRDQ